MGVKSSEDKRSNLEPTMIAFEFKAVFKNSDLKSIKCTTNWKTDKDWQQEIIVDDTDWLDSKGRESYIS